MKEKIWGSKKAIFALGFLFVLLLAMFSLFFGYPIANDSSILASVWRTWNGQTPYRDFIFHQPPLSLFIHRFWMLFDPRAQLPLARFSVYLWMGAIWWVGALRLIPLLFENRRAWKGIALSTFTLFWFYSVHNYPAVPGYATDAVALATISLFLLVEAMIREEKKRPRSNILWFTSAFLAGLAPLAQKSFVLLPLLHLGFAMWALLSNRRRRKTSTPAAEVVGVLAGPLLLSFYLSASDLWPRFIDQMMGVPKSCGLHSCLLSCTASFILIATAATLSAWAMRRREEFVFISSLVALGVTAWKFGDWFQGASRGLFLFVTVWILASLIFRLRKTGLKASEWTLGIGSIAVAAMSSFNTNYPFPALGFAGLGAFIALVLAVPHAQNASSTPKPPFKRAAFFMATAMLALVLALNSAAPFQEHPRSELTYDLAWLYRKFGPKLMTNLDTFREVQAVQFLADKYTQSDPSRPLLVFPDFSDFYWVSRRKNFLPLDNWGPEESRAHIQELEELLRLRAPLVLFHLKSIALVGCKNAINENDPITQWLLAHSRVREQLGAYCVLDVSK